jgi:hypothetical protein
VPAVLSTKAERTGPTGCAIPPPDPDKTWHEAAPHVLYQLNAYAAWAAKVGWRQPWLNMPGEQIRDTHHLRELGLLLVTDVETFIISDVHPG